MIKRIDVFAKGLKVGTLALTNDKRVAFQYSEEWTKNGFSINPLKLPLTKDIYYSSYSHSKGLFGVFADSLPDSYGELLLDRFLKFKGIDIDSLNCLERLAYVGKRGMGMFEYVPDFSSQDKQEKVDFDELQKECDALFDSKEVKNIANLFYYGGSSGGARPKSLIKYLGEDWIVKFTSRFDPKNVSVIEYDYMSMAREAGINIPQIRLLRTSKGNKYFLIKRFDREKDKKIHMISAAALLEIDFKALSLDYNSLIKLTRVLTSDENDVLEMYRRMVFNVFINNQDDHAKNFAFIFDDKDKKYRLSPAYDITPTKTFYNEHSTTINGKGKDITEDDLLEFAKINNINISKAKNIISKVKEVLLIK